MAVLPRPDKSDFRQLAFALFALPSGPSNVPRVVRTDLSILRRFLKFW